MLHQLGREEAKFNILGKVGIFLGFFSYAIFLAVFIIDGRFIEGILLIFPCAFLAYLLGIILNTAGNMFGIK
ncbi:MAG: hypothetical protein NTV39_02270 [Candidatus Saccharibacteria bacterium]|nr:hypothetical protein [Candidatus Saccharibacteria bacterium]